MRLIAEVVYWLIFAVYLGSTNVFLLLVEKKYTTALNIPQPSWILLELFEHRTWIATAIAGLAVGFRIWCSRIAQDGAAISFAVILALIAFYSQFVTAVIIVSMLWIGKP